MSVRSRWTRTVGDRRRRVAVVAIAIALLTRDVLAAAPCAVTLSGANVAGGEFNGGKPAAVHARDYIYPAATEITLLKRLGLKLMRVPFLWERLQPTALGALDAAELARLDEVVARARAAGLVVVLDAHNYGTYHGVSLTRRESPDGALPDLWRRLAKHYGGEEDVVFGLMNEPHDIDVDTWATIAKTTLAAIRSTAATNVVLVPGTHWDGAHSWFGSGGGRSNAQALLPLARGDDRVVFEVHQYFDDNYSGTSATCGGASRVAPALTRIGEWARTNRVRLMLGEFGVSRNTECVEALDRALGILERDRDVWYGWTYWSAGAWWGDYMFNIQTPDEAPQARVLRERASRLDRLSCRPGP